MTIHRIHWNKPFDIPCRHGALTIGNFDGVHRGHQALLAELCRHAEAAGGPAVVMTFDPHPEQLLRPDYYPHFLTTIECRAALLREHGADFVLILQTTHDLLQLHAREFFDHVIRNKIQPKTVVPGFNFRFGHNREGTVDTLAEFCHEAGMKCVPVPPTLFKEETVSSSRIRAALQAGNVHLATELLGRPYSLAGIVHEGQRRGQQLGFPTANLEEIHTVIPANGVYAVRVHAGNDIWPGAANVGPNPTFGEEHQKVEVHLIDFQGDLYNTTLTVDFIVKLRGVQKLTSAQELMEQLQRDVEAARRAVSEEC